MMKSWLVRWLVCFATLGLLAARVWAAEDDAPQHEQVELFSAIKNGDLQVAFVPKNSRAATVVIRNKTKQPLSVKLPEAFAGVPVLAQFGGGIGGRGIGGGMGGFGGGGMTQALGGGFGGGLGGGGLGGGRFGGGGGGFFDVEPEKAAKIKVACVCLEHGKKDPNSSIKYKIVPLPAVTKSGAIAELCKMLGRGEVDQTSAQVAAWHLANGLSFERLAAKTLRHVNGAISPYFDRRNIALGMRIVDAATERAHQAEQRNAASKIESLSAK